MRTEVKYVELTKRLMETSNKKIKLKDKGIKFQKKISKFLRERYSSPRHTKNHLHL